MKSNSRNTDTKNNNNSSRTSKSRGNVNRKPNSKGNGRRRKGKDKDEAVLTNEEVRARDLHNDPNWYFTDATLASQASQLSFQQFLGSPEAGVQDWKVPTIMTLHVNPSPGSTYKGAPSVSIADKSGFNMSMVKLFNRLSMKSGRNMNYAPQDVGMCMLAQGEILSLISYVRRLFGIAQTYNYRNRQFPKQVIKAMGIDPDDFFANFSDYRMRFNTALASVNQIPILTNSGYFRKCMTLYDNLYTDTDNSMAQIYIHVPNTTWIIDESSQQTGTYLKTVPVVYKDDTNETAPEVRKFANFMDTIFEPLISAMLESSTLNLVYADLLNLATLDSLTFMKFESIDDSYTVMPIHDPMILKQIHNTTIMNNPAAIGNGANYTNSNDVYSDPSHNAIQYSPCFRFDVEMVPDIESSQYVLPIIIDTDNDNPDLAERIEITRWLGAYGAHRVIVNNVGYMTLPTLADHYVTQAVIYTTNVDKDHMIRFNTIMVEKATAATLDINAAVEEFDWHPYIYWLWKPASSTYYRVRSVQADLSFFTTVDVYYLRRLNQIVFMGLFELR